MQSDIVVRGLVKRFGNATALKGINLASKRGINIVLGPNGAGKSTLLKCIDGLYKPSRGDVAVLGSDPYVDSHARSRISLLADMYGLYDFLSVKDNLRFFGKFYGMRGDEAIDKTDAMVGELDLKQYLNTKVEALSRGTKQKVAFCRMMLNDAQVLLLDEPTAFLDANASNTVRRHVQRLAHEGRTIMFVTQRLDEVTRLNSRILVLRKGRLVSETDAEGLYRAVFKGTDVSVRFARPVSERVVESVRNVVWKNAKEPTLLRVRVNSYREVNRVVKTLIDGGAYVVSVDYAEPALEKLVFGGSG
jgi:ABC-type multidrug transport system ATPase subunit